MSESEREPSKEERNRLFVERMKIGAERNSVQARAEEWRVKSMEERANVGLSVVALAQEILRSRRFPSQRPPLGPSLKQVTESAREARGSS